MEQAVPPLETTVKLYRDSAGASDLLGFAEIVIAGSFVIKGIRILMSKAKDDKPARPFVSFPAKKGNGAASDKWFEIAHPVTAEARKAVQECVLGAYERAAASAGRLV